MHRLRTCGQETARTSAHAVGAEALCQGHFSMCWLVVIRPRPHMLAGLIPGLREMHGAGRDGAALKSVVYNSRGVRAGVIKTGRFWLRREKWRSLSLFY